MKNIIGILGVFILAISCSGGKKESADAGLELTEDSVVYLLADNVTLGIKALFPFIDKDGHEYLTFQNQLEPEICVYDLQSGEFVKSIFFDREGANGVGMFGGYHIIDFDEIYLPSLQQSKVFVMEESGKKKREIIVTNSETGESKTYLIPYGSRIKVQDGVMLEAGDELTEGSVNPHDILKIKGLRAAQDYLLREVQRVYRLQGVEINDKHIEVIVRQMLKKIRIENNGDSDFQPGVMVDALDYEDVKEQLEAEGKQPPEGNQVILGITKASLATNSFLSAASFQETTKVLTDAAIKGKVDPLIGLKENVIIGKLIPAGTGMKRYRNIKLHSDLVDSLEPPEPVEEAVEVVEEEKEKEVKILVKDPDVELDIAEDEEIAMTEADDDVVTIEE